MKGLLDIRNNSISQDGIISFCEQETLLTEITADCAAGLEENSREVDCPCCIACCSDDLPPGTCEKDVAASCALMKNNYETELGRFYEGERGAICQCVEDGYRVSCEDTKCQACTLDGEICAVSKDYGFFFEDYIVQNPFIILFTTGWTSTLQYVKGRNETVKFNEVFDPFTLSFSCSVTVNGEECRECTRQACLDGFTGLQVKCDNIGYENIDVCDGAVQDGPLAIFSLQDELVRDGCPPKRGFEFSGL